MEADDSKDRMDGLIMSRSMGEYMLQTYSHLESAPNYSIDLFAFNSLVK